MLRTLSSLLCLLAAVPLCAEEYQLIYWKHMGEVPLGHSREVVHRLCAVEGNTQPLFVEVQLVEDRPGWSLQVGNHVNQANDFPTLPGRVMDGSADNSSDGENGAGIINSNVVALPPGQCTHLTMTLQSQNLGETEANVRLNRLDCVGTPQECSQDRLVKAQVVDARSSIYWRGEIALPNAADKAFFTGDGNKLRVMTGAAFQDFRLSGQNPDFRYLQGNVFNAASGISQVCNSGEYLADSQILRVRNQQSTELVNVPVPNGRSDDGFVRVINGTCGDPGQGIRGRVEAWFEDIGMWVPSCTTAFDDQEAEALCNQLGYDPEKGMSLGTCEMANASSYFLLNCGFDSRSVDDCTTFHLSADPRADCHLGTDNGISCRPFLPVNGCSAPGSAVFWVTTNGIQYTSLASLINDDPQFTSIDNFQGIGDVISWFSPDQNTLFLVTDSIIAQFNIQGRTATLEKRVPLENRNSLITGRAESNVVYLSDRNRQFIDRVDFSASVQDMVEQIGHNRLSNNRMMSLSENDLLTVLNDGGRTISVFSESGADRLSLDSVFVFFFTLVGGFRAL